MGRSCLTRTSSNLLPCGLPGRNSTGSRPTNRFSFHPELSAAHDLLPLPDGQRALDRPYSIAARLKGFFPVLRGNSHGDADLPNRKTPLPVKDLDLLDGPPLSNLCLDLPYLLLGHRAVRLVLQPLHRMTLVDAADGPQEEHDSPCTLVLHRVDHFSRVDSPSGQVSRRGGASLHRFPPATGGRRATSSPSWSTVLGSASWELTATLIERFIAASFGCFFETVDSRASIVELSERVIASSLVPAASRACAK